MSTAALIHDLATRGVEFSARGDRLIIDAPKGALRPDEIGRLRDHKREVLALLKPHAEIAAAVPSPSAITEAPNPAGEALDILARLKGYTLPSGRMATARAIAERLRPLLAVAALDTAEALVALKTTEAELTALGGSYDPDLAAAIGLVTGVFSSARVIQLQ